MCAGQILLHLNAQHFSSLARLARGNLRYCEDICENAPYLTFFLLTLEMRAASMHHSIHFTSQQPFGSSVFFYLISKLTLKREGEKGHSACL